MARSARGAIQIDTVLVVLGAACAILGFLTLLLGPFVAAVLWRNFGPM